MILEKCETYLKEVDKKSVIFTDFGNFLHFILSFNELSDLVVSHKVALYYTVPLRFLPMGHFGVLFLSLFSRISMFFRPNLTTKSNVPVQLLFFLLLQYFALSMKIRNAKCGGQNGIYVKFTQNPYTQKSCFA